VDDQRRVAVRGFNPGAHLFEWFDDPIHWAPRQRGVPDQSRDEGLTGQYSDKHSHRGARIPSVEGNTGRTEAVQSSSEYRNGAVGISRRFDSQVSQAGQRGLAIGAWGVPDQTRRTMCLRGQQSVSV
jgi:hypothetical protein